MPGLLLFGGSFDPIHHGHLIPARDIAERLNIDRILLIPGAKPPHKQDARLADAKHRFAMCRAAVAGDPLFDVSDWELHQQGPTYTVQTVRHYREITPSDVDLYWLIGMDSLLELGTWYQIDQLADLCILTTAARPGFRLDDWSHLENLLSPDQIKRIANHVIESSRIEISATAIRRRVAHTQSVRYLVPDPVAAYIATHRLYQSEHA